MRRTLGRSRDPWTSAEGIGEALSFDHIFEKTPGASAITD
jgi:hypothetical protein